MTGPEHFREAERLTDQANSWANADMGWKAHLSSEERIAHRMADLADAQVHATLALAAATALNDYGTEADGGGMPLDDLNQWRETVGINLQKKAS